MHVLSATYTKRSSMNSKTVSVPLLGPVWSRLTKKLSPVVATYSFQGTDSWILCHPDTRLVIFFSYWGVKMIFYINPLRGRPRPQSLSSEIPRIGLVSVTYSHHIFFRCFAVSTLDILTTQRVFLFRFKKNRGWYRSRTSFAWQRKSREKGSLEMMVAVPLIGPGKTKESRRRCARVAVLSNVDINYATSLLYCTLLVALSLLASLPFISWLEQHQTNGGWITVPYVNVEKFLETFRLRISCIRANSPENNRFLPLSRPAPKFTSQSSGWLGISNFQNAVNRVYLSYG